jgi:hypothetical protein
MRRGFLLSPSSPPRARVGDPAPSLGLSAAPTTSLPPSPPPAPPPPPPPPVVAAFEEPVEAALDAAPGPAARYRARVAAVLGVRNLQPASRLLVRLHAVVPPCDAGSSGCSASGDSGSAGAGGGAGSAAGAAQSDTPTGNTPTPPWAVASSSLATGAVANLVVADNGSLRLTDPAPGPQLQVDTFAFADGVQRVHVVALAPCGAAVGFSAVHVAPPPPPPPAPTPSPPSRLAPRGAPERPLAPPPPATVAWVAFRWGIGRLRMRLR